VQERGLKIKERKIVKLREKNLMPFTNKAAEYFSTRPVSKTRAQSVCKATPCQKKVATFQKTSSTFGGELLWIEVKFVSNWSHWAVDRSVLDMGLFIYMLAWMNGFQCLLQFRSSHCQYCYQTFVSFVVGGVSETTRPMLVKMMARAGFHICEVLG